VNPMTRGANAYKQTEATSRSPLELVVMLYDGALRFVGEAAEAQAARQIAKRARAISRAIAILGELQSTLNVKEGGEVAKELDKLYAYMQGRLLDVTMRQDAAALAEVKKLLTTLRDAWSQVAAPNAQASAPQARAT
jgi:flagellar secretion chaperone FliS